MDFIGANFGVIFAGVMVVFFGIIAYCTNLLNYLAKYFTGWTLGVLLFAMGAALLFWWAENLPLPNSDSSLPAKEQLENQILQEEMRIYQ